MVEPFSTQRADSSEEVDEIKETDVLLDLIQDKSDANSSQKLSGIEYFL